MLFRPISAYPNEGIGIDASLSNTFSTIIQGSSSIVSGYKVSIFNSSDFEEVYSTNKVSLLKTLTSGETLNIPIPINSGMQNGNSYYWTLSLYQQRADIFISNTVVQEGSTSTRVRIRIHNNIKSGMYFNINGQQRLITSYTSYTEEGYGEITLSTPLSYTPSVDTNAKIYSDFVESLQFAFSAKKTPTLVINNVPDILDTRKYNFIMDYFQEQFDPIKWYRFQVLDSKKDIVFETNRIFNSSLQFEFNGFISGETYCIQGSAENVEGAYIETENYEFEVQYQAPSIEREPIPEINYPDTSIKIEWGNDMFSEGEATGDYHFEKNIPFDGTNSLVVDSGSVTYDNIGSLPLSIEDNNFAIFTDIIISDTTNGKILELNGEDNCYVEVKGNTLSVIKNGIILASVSVLNGVEPVLQDSSVPTLDTSYVWEDSQIWDDNLFWTETDEFQKRFKITILTESAYIVEVPINGG